MDDKNEHGLIVEFLRDISSRLASLEQKIDSRMIALEKRVLKLEESSIASDTLKKHYNRLLGFGGALLIGCVGYFGGLIEHLGHLFH